jgi:aspartate-semialdehyde dehydrogenase
MKRIKVAVMGCTGLVGQQFVKLLDEHPYFELAALTSSSRSAGKGYGRALNWAVGGEIPEAAREMEVSETAVDALLKSQVKVVFSAVPAFLAEKIEHLLRAQGLFIFSNASTHRMDEDVPILIPEINPGHFALVRKQMSRHKGFIVTNSNCSTSGLAMVLAPLEPLGMKSVTVTTFQSISGAGRRGLAAMDIAANAIPFIKNEEEKMEGELQKILGQLDRHKIVSRNLPVNASCCRIPVREGHLLSIVVDFLKEVDVGDVEKALSNFSSVPQALKLPTAPERPVIVRQEEDRPQPVLDVHAGQPERARGMAVTVGRIRKKARSINLFALVHNTVRGAAGTCLLSAELAFQKGLVH